MTELQPGSFVFMDIDYERIGGPDRTRVSRLQERADRRDDGGIDAAGLCDRRRRLQGVLDRSPVHAAADRPGRSPTGGPATNTGVLSLEQAPRPLKVGDRIEFIPPHCDPTVNLYDSIHALARRSSRRRCGRLPPAARANRCARPCGASSKRRSTAKSASTRSRARSIRPTPASTRSSRSGSSSPDPPRRWCAPWRWPPVTRCRSRRAAAARPRPASRLAPASCSTPRST